MQLKSLLLVLIGLDIELSSSELNSIVFFACRISNLMLSYANVAPVNLSNSLLQNQKT